MDPPSGMDGKKMVKQGNSKQDRLEVRWEAVMFLFNVRVGYVEVVVVLLYEIVSINVHLMLDAFFVSFHCIFSYFTFTNWTFQRVFPFIT